MTIIPTELDPFIQRGCFLRWWTRNGVLRGITEPFPVRVVAVFVDEVDHYTSASVALFRLFIDTMSVDHLVDDISLSQGHPDHFPVLITRKSTTQLGTPDTGGEGSTILCYMQNSSGDKIGSRVQASLLMFLFPRRKV